MNAKRKTPHLDSHFTPLNNSRTRAQSSFVEMGHWTASAPVDEKERLFGAQDVPCLVYPSKRTQQARCNMFAFGYRRRVYCNERRPQARYSESSYRRAWGKNECTSSRAVGKKTHADGKKCPTYVNAESVTPEALQSLTNTSSRVAWLTPQSRTSISPLRDKETWARDVGERRGRET